MTRTELTPINDTFAGFGNKTKDSIVGSFIAGNGQEMIAKWNKRDLHTNREAIAAARYLLKSIALYKHALGSQFVAESSVAVGAKNDQGRIKHKVFIFQEPVKGYTASNAPCEVLSDFSVRSQWNTLNSRLFKLFNAARFVNEKCKEEFETPFPIGLTLGSSRRLAYDGVVNSEIPRTSNLLIDAESLQLKVCDFGEYLAWNDTMTPAYEEILARTKIG